jgi:hypothetical protein
VPPIYMSFSAHLLRCIKRPSVRAVGALPHYRGSRAIARNYIRDTSYALETARNTKGLCNGVPAFGGAARLRRMHYRLNSSIRALTGGMSSSP